MNEKKKCDVQRPLECVRERFSASVASQVVCNGFVRLVLAIEIDKNRFEEGDQLDAFMICLRAARSRPTRKINTFFLMKFIFTFSHNLGEISRKILLPVIEFNFELLVCINKSTFILISHSKMNFPKLIKELF